MVFLFCSLRSQSTKFFFWFSFEVFSIRGISNSGLQWVNGADGSSLQLRSTVQIFFDWTWRVIKRSCQICLRAKKYFGSQAFIANKTIQKKKLKVLRNEAIHKKNLKFWRRAKGFIWERRIEGFHRERSELARSAKNFFEHFPPLKRKSWF